MSSVQVDKVAKTLQSIPDAPGVYIMKGGKGRVLYVGKAKRLSSRVRSYFQKQDVLTAKTRALVGAVASIDYIVTGGEVEALVLECNLIKEHRPRYNIRLKDDKRYPFLKLTLNERFPRLAIVRNVEKDGAEYYGPYTDSRAVRHTLRLIGSIFPLRKCRSHALKKSDRECLNFHIKRCLAPCTGRICEREYRKIVEQVRLFLKGRNGELMESLRSRMDRASNLMQYEEAAALRDQIESLGRITQKQLALSPLGNDEDAVALAREGDLSCGVVMKIREGKMLGTEVFFLAVGESDNEKDMIGAFLELYYHTATDIPPTILVQARPADAGLLERWLTRRTDRRTTVTAPRRGDKKKLIELACRNASLKILSRLSSKKNYSGILQEIKETLSLAVTPFRIEAFDISNIHGAQAVGSMVTFENGRPLTSRYRHYKIRDVEGIDDFAMMREILKRRLKHIKEGKDRHPDLIVVDGGAGQLSAARSAMVETGIDDIACIGLAKKHEEIYREGLREPLRLPARSVVLRFFQQVRNEAHRFAVEYHRKLRSKTIVQSELDAIPGIGEKRKILLLVEFGSIGALREASRDEIASVHGIGGTIAEEIYRYLHER